VDRTKSDSRITGIATALDALALQRPLPDDALRIVSKGEKEDGVAALH
jgi:hypothetical protein